MSIYIGHVSLKAFAPTPYNRADCVSAAKETMLPFVAEGSFKSFRAVFEEGTECGQPHFHFYLETAKSSQTVRRLFAKHWRKGEEGQWFSLKAGDPGRLERYVKYLAKGVSGKRGDNVEVLWDSDGYVHACACVCACAPPHLHGCSVCKCPYSPS